MPEHKRILGPEDTRSPLLFVSEEERGGASKGKKKAVSKFRKDGRKPADIRSLFLNFNMNPHATGSAYLELGSTKVLSSVYGPRESPRREEFIAKGRLNCEFKFASFSCCQRRRHQQDQEEKEYSTVIAEALQRAVLLDKFVKLQFDVNVFVVENAGSALAAALLCASVALATSGVEMYDLPVACSLVKKESTFLLDPAVGEEYNGDLISHDSAVKGSLTVTYLPSCSEVTSLLQYGVLSDGDFQRGMDLCVQGCVKIHRKVKDLLKQHVQDISQVSL